MENNRFLRSEIQIALTRCISNSAINSVCVDVTSALRYKQYYSRVSILLAQTDVVLLQSMSIMTFDAGAVCTQSYGLNKLDPKNEADISSSKTCH